MPKRKDPSNGSAMEVDDEDDSGSDMEVLDVDLELFDPNPEVDFHGLKTLLRQLLDVDNQLFDLSAIADLILAQPLLGTTVKFDGIESDPYAFLTVINLKEHAAKPAIQTLVSYIASKASSTSSIPRLLSPESSETQVGLILHERLLNMPAEIVPPMYNMLLEEIQWALDEKEPYQFTHYLILSKTYTEVASRLDAEENRPNKKKKGSGSKDAEGGTFYFHPEDEVLQRSALESYNYPYTTVGEEGASDAKRAFQEAGIVPQGHLILIEAAKFKEAIEAVKQFVDGAS